MVCRDDNFCPKLEYPSLFLVSFDDLDAITSFLEIPVCGLCIDDILAERIETMVHRLGDLLDEVFCEWHVVYTGSEHRTDVVEFDGKWEIEE